MVHIMSHTPSLNDPSKMPSPWQTRLASGTEARVELPSSVTEDTNAVWLGFSEVALPEPIDAQFLGSSAGTFQVWLNGRSIHQRTSSGAFKPDSDRFEARLDRGRNSLVVQLPAQDYA